MVEGEIHEKAHLMGWEVHDAATMRRRERGQLGEIANRMRRRMDAVLTAVVEGLRE